ncbi:CPBP family intramembrane metalloprotease [Candidatus Saccharibacteria bacterium]|nr:CPBP family intramembrane metalloprotease [Candidatus Saccharibacteria bacterium]MCL1962777.1 CPBP family intramembrane metalloprotease [Candidatus Saccharibacteria bacterium]
MKKVVSTKTGKTSVKKKVVLAEVIAPMEKAPIGKRIASIVGWLLWIAAAFLLSNIIVAIMLLILQHYQLLDIKKLDTTTSFAVTAVMYVLMLVIVLWLPLWWLGRKKVIASEAEQPEKKPIEPQKTRREKIRYILDAVGLSRRPKLTDISYFFADLPVYYLVNIVASSVATYILGSEIMNQEQSLGFSKTGNAWWQLVIIFIALVVIAPLFEEMIMRGFLFKKIRKNVPFIVTAVVVSLLFALAHGQVNAGIMTFTLSMFCCWIREKTGAIWGGIFLHAVNNFVAFAILFLSNH